MKKHSIKFLVATIALLFSLSAYANQFSKTYSDYKNSIPIIINSGGICSGALIEKNIILTAAHCVDSNRGRPLYVSWPDQPKANILVKVAYLSKEHDLALIQLPTNSNKKLFSILGIKSPLKPGDAVATIGHPTISNVSAKRNYDLDYVYLLSVGVISKVNEDNLITDTSISPGNSGGPLLSENGKIVGVISRKRVGTAIGNIGVAPNHKIIHDFIQDYIKGKKSISTEFYNMGFNFFDFSLLYTYHSIGVRHSIIDKETMTFAFSSDYHRKYFLKFQSAIFRKGFSFYKTSFGYNHHIDFTEFSGLKLQASLDHVFYDLNLKGTEETIVNGVGYSVGFIFSKFPLGVRYSGFQTKAGDNEYIIDVNLSGEF